MADRVAQIWRAVLCTIVMFAGLIGPIARADTLSSPAAARKLTDQAMEKIASGDIESGMLLLKPYVLISSAEFDATLEKVKLQLPTIRQRFGLSVGYEFLGEKTLGSSLIRITHLQKFERHPVTWVFIFYKGTNAWVLDSFNFQDKIQDAFQN